MTAAMIVLTVLATIIALCTFAALAWLFRTLKWEVVEYEELSHRSAGSWRWLKGWPKPRPRMLTYRRDHRGRFRRHRR